MSVSEEWPEFTKPEAILRNTGVYPIGYPKPTLRWRHNEAYPAWIAEREDGMAVTAIMNTHWSIPDVRYDEFQLATFALNSGQEIR